MAYQEAKDFLEERGFADRILTFAVSSATVELAAAAVGTEPGHIVKSLTFLVNEGAVMVLCAGDGKVSNSKFKNTFLTKAKMLSGDQVHDMIGHDVGGVCPFGIRPGVRVCLDESIRRYDVLYPACGSSNTAVRLTLEELESLCGGAEWVDVCVVPE